VLKVTRSDNASINFRSRAGLNLYDPEYLEILACPLGIAFGGGACFDFLPGLTSAAVAVTCGGEKFLAACDDPVRFGKPLSRSKEGLSGMVRFQGRSNRWQTPRPRLVVSQLRLTVPKVYASSHKTLSVGPRKYFH